MKKVYTQKEAFTTDKVECYYCGTKETRQSMNCLPYGWTKKEWKTDKGNIELKFICNDCRIG
jgi:hypothetical protein